MGPLHFIIYINDFPVSINPIFYVLLFDDDTIVLATHDNYNFKQKANLALFI